MFTSLVSQELPVFVSMVKDVFGRADLTTSAVGLKESFMQDVLSASLPMAPTASRKLLSPPKLAFVSELLKQQVSKDHLVPSPHWMAKVEQLFIQSQLKHGNIHVIIISAPLAIGTHSCIPGYHFQLFIMKMHII